MYKIFVLIFSLQMTVTYGTWCNGGTQCDVCDICPNECPPFWVCCDCFTGDGQGVCLFFLGGCPSPSEVDTYLKNVTNVHDAMSILAEKRKLN
uniref:Uncharacterized protein n=1 Tax=Acrobeloides nanus TaxID=290746 RepID=A0A914CMW4_9BILA